MKLSMKKNLQCKTVQEAFQEFIMYKRSLNLTEESIKDYKMMFSIFTEFYGENELCININVKVIEKYIDYLQTKPRKENNPKGQEKTAKFLSSVTIATYIRHLRVIINYFIKQGYTPKFIVPMPKSQKDVKETYNENELKLLLKKPDLKSCSFSEYRNWVLTNYFLATANRLSTVLNILICDLHFDDNEIYLRHVKNRKPYAIPMQKQLKKILFEYLNYRNGQPEDPLFCSENDDKKPLTSSALKTVMGRYNQQRGVAKTSVHIYRNTFAKHWILSGGDLIRLKEMLGHRTLAMVLEYVEMYSNDLQKNFDSFNPLSQYSTGDHIKMRM